MIPRRSVGFEVRVDGGDPRGAPIALHGEITDWLNGAALDARPAPGAADAAVAHVALELPVGVYAYKLKVGAGPSGRWALDAANPRTRGGPLGARGDGSARNNVLVVGGTAEPVIFAPAPPFVVEEDGGGIVITALLRRGHGERLVVRWRERASIGGGWDAVAETGASAGTIAIEPEGRTEMTAIAALAEDEHLVFQARLGTSAAKVVVRFEDGAGRPIGDAVERVERMEIARSPAAEDVPAWWRRAVVYTVLVDRFRAARSDEGWGAAPWWNEGAGRAERRDLARAVGGHLDGIRRSLDDLAEIGVTALYLTPIHPAASAHRYDVVDPLAIDPAVGGEAAFARLVDDAHARGMKILVDVSFSHAGRGFAPFEDVLAHGRASAFAPWFLWEPGGGGLRHYGSRTDAALFDQTCAEVQAIAVATVEAWARRGADGLRLDAVAEVPMDLARKMRARFKELRPDGVVLGEVVPAHAWRWRVERAVDVATDFGFRDVAVDLFARATIDVAEAARRLAAGELRRGGARHTAMRFLSTHDHPRFATIARAAATATATAGTPGGARVALALLFLFASPGTPALLYGEEIGLSAAELVEEVESVWPDRAPMRWPRERAHDRDRDEKLRRLVGDLAAARRGSAALTDGDFEVISAENGIFAARRTAMGDVVDIVVNVGDDAAAVTIDDDVRAGIDVLAQVGDVTLGDADAGAAVRAAAHAVDAATVRLGPWAGVIARRVPRTPLRVDVDVDRLRDRDRDRELAVGALGARTGPARIDFALTETCNLRCRHCITFAPERTRTQTARTLAPWLVARLDAAIAGAAYFGFVHGGESLAAPHFFDVLAAIRAARGAQPYVVHLLTNGVLLGEKTARRAIAGGVRSISVSLDGATAASNDDVRAGGRFDVITENVRGVVRLRKETGADLRLGVSTVVMQRNLDELGAIVELAADLGVDWIKLEEIAAVTPYARASLVRPSEARVRDAIDRAVLRGKALGLVVVDHTDPPRVFRCKTGDDARAAAFLAADEFANRSTIHPCRVPWDHACVEPNGDVKIADFFAPPIGNLAQASFDEIWSGAAARRIREAAPLSRPCGHGPVVCVAPPA